MPASRPATDSGEPVDSLFDFVVFLRYSRWTHPGERFTGRIDGSW